ncbi:ClbS/DfsB family four-helix bundle protein [Rhodobacteraceae bacterium CCMM004]|nr:ClbS/DfsB family four-helix bundle protein [Rhodobacteraceae bacterium CCMM004]
MPAATDKTALIAVTDRELAKLSASIADIDAQTACAPDDDGTAIKDVIAHRAHWIDLFLGWWREGQAGGTPEMPAPGYTWRDLKRYNADLRARQAHLDWDAVRGLLAERAARLRSFIEGQDDAALYGGPMPGGGNAWTTGRWAEAAGPSHYRSATKYVRARLRALGRTPPRA